MWVRFAGGGTVINYSDGTQATDPAAGLTDDLRDVDNDLLSNQAEANGRFTRAYWRVFFEDEVEYPVAYADLDFLDADSDGDGRIDGEDDLDHDGYANIDDFDRGKPLPDKFDASLPAEGRWVQPFNPCLPDPESPTCSRYLTTTIDSAWAPFKQLKLGPGQIPINSTYPRPLPTRIIPATD